MRRLILYADGASRGNPGPAGAGAHLSWDDGTTVAEISEFLGKTTNNVAEYRSLLAGLKAALPLAPAPLVIRMDSQLVIRQLSGAYAVRHPELQKLHRQAGELLNSFPKVVFEHIPRAQNAAADRLANRGVDQGLK